jgi:hypothetical protein
MRRLWSFVAMIHANLSGKWIFSGKPVKDGKTGSGRIEMTIRHAQSLIVYRVIVIVRQQFADCHTPKC